MRSKYLGFASCAPEKPKREGGRLPHLFWLHSAAMGFAGFAAVGAVVARAHPSLTVFSIALFLVNWRLAAGQVPKDQA